MDSEFSFVLMTSIGHFINMQYTNIHVTLGDCRIPQKAVGHTVHAQFHVHPSVSFKGARYLLIIHVAMDFFFCKGTLEEESQRLASY